MKFTDWQISNIERDIESIKKGVKKQNRTFTTTLLMLFLDLIAILVACNWEQNKTYDIILICIAGSLLLFYFFVGYIVPKLVFYKKAKHRLVSVDKYVDLFDNKVCKYIMQAKVFEKEANKVSGLECQFYYSEMSYYVKKAIITLLLTENHIESIYSNNTNEHAISFRRLIMVCMILKECRDYLNTALLNDTTGLKTENDIYYSSMKEFIKSVDEVFVVSSKIQW